MTALSEDDDFPEYDPAPHDINAVPISVGTMVKKRGTDDPWMRVEEIDWRRLKALCSWGDDSEQWFRLVQLESVDRCC